MSPKSATPWEGRSIEAAAEFAQKCLELRRSNPCAEIALDRVINDLMTELWDLGFSQSEIRSAFTNALEDMPRYAAGHERRGA